MVDRAWNDPPLANVIRDGRLACSLEEAALVLARQEYPDLDPAPWLAQLDAIANRTGAILSAQPDLPECIGALSDVLFRDLGFHGNRTHYADPRNSFLNDVLARRTGIPITLATVYLACARRIGVTLHGTNFPGHFLLIAPRDGWPIVVDAFGSGRILSVGDCERLAAHAGVSGYRDVPRPATDLAILRRMLENLRHIYTDAKDWVRLLRTSAQILAVSPGDVAQYRLQGLALANLGETDAAVEALDLFLAADPNAEVAPAIRALQRRLRATQDFRS